MGRFFLFLYSYLKPTGACLFLLVFFSSSYAQRPSTADTIPLSVGDIVFDKAIDDSSFQPCDASRIFQYYNTGSYYLDNKDTISHYLLRQFHPVADVRGQTGYLTIKFIINCNGLTGRFRVSEMDSDYHAFSFDKRLSGHLLDLVKALKGWKAPSYKGKSYDSYQYITFRILNGKIISISP